MPVRGFVQENEKRMSLFGDDTTSIATRDIFRLRRQ